MSSTRAVSSRFIICLIAVPAAPVVFRVSRRFRLVLGRPKSNAPEREGDRASEISPFLRSCLDSLVCFASSFVSPLPSVRVLLPLRFVSSLCFPIPLPRRPPLAPSDPPPPLSPCPLAPLPSVPRVHSPKQLARARALSVTTTTTITPSLLSLPATSPCFHRRPLFVSASPRSVSVRFFTPCRAVVPPLPTHTHTHTQVFSNPINFACRLFFFFFFSFNCSFYLFFSVITLLSCDITRSRVKRVTTLDVNRGFFFFLRHK